MTRNIFDYFARRAQEEEQRAAASQHPIVRETHRRFAEFYRERERFRDTTTNRHSGLEA